MRHALTTCRYSDKACVRRRPLALFAWPRDNARSKDDENISFMVTHAKPERRERPTDDTALAAVVAFVKAEETLLKERAS